MLQKYLQSLQLSLFQRRDGTSWFFQRLRCKNHQSLTSVKRRSSPPQIGRPLCLLGTLRVFLIRSARCLHVARSLLFTVCRFPPPPHSISVSPRKHRLTLSCCSRRSTHVSMRGLSRNMHLRLLAVGCCSAKAFWRSRTVSLL